MQHFWYEANLDHKDTQCAVLGDVQSPGLAHLQQPSLLSALGPCWPSRAFSKNRWIWFWLFESFIAFRSFAPPSIPSKEFPHLEVSSPTNHFLQSCIDLFRPLKKTVPQVGSRQAGFFLSLVPLQGTFIHFLAGHTTVNADKIATTKSAWSSSLFHVRGHPGLHGGLRFPAWSSKLC